MESLESQENFILGNSMVEKHQESAETGLAIIEKLKDMDAYLKNDKEFRKNIFQIRESDQNQPMQSLNESVLQVGSHLS